MPTDLAEEGELLSPQQIKNTIRNLRQNFKDDLRVFLEIWLIMKRADLEYELTMTI